MTPAVVTLYQAPWVDSRRTILPRVDHHKPMSAGCVSGIIGEVEVEVYPLNDLLMSKGELGKLSQMAVRGIPELLGGVIKHAAESKPGFESSIQWSEHDMAGGRPAADREPQGS